MTTEIQLHHIGEVVLAGLMRELAERGRCNAICLLHENCTLPAVLDRAEVGPPLVFDANVPLGPTTVNGEKVLFDGAHGVDVLCRGSGLHGLAIEAKLGLDRMASGEFKKRFLAPVSLTTHTHRRIKGSMVAILNYRALQHGEALPLHTLRPPTQLAPSWFLVIRAAVWRRWESNGHRPPLAPNAHLALFESIVRDYGNGGAFDALVHRLVGDRFYEHWNLEPC